MTRILVNGLSIGSMSGAHVLFGHLEQLVHHAENKAELIVLLQPGLALPEACKAENVHHIEASGMSRHWTTRWVWEMQSVPKLIRKYACNKYFTPAGTILPGCNIPQYSLAQNPWPMVKHLHRNWIEKFKGKQLRQAYRIAYKKAACMIYNSHFMHDLYENNAAAEQGGKWIVAYQGINEETFQDASRMNDTLRKPFSILSVSAMAHWKGAEILIKAVRQLRDENIPAVATFVGPWPDIQYQQHIEKLIDTEKVRDFVQIKGKVSNEQLKTEYASHRVYCLMSECESFGIPAVEAQAFGTPVVGSTGCAMPEVSGKGGLYAPPRDVKQVKNLLKTCLTNENEWQRLSTLAKENAALYHWNQCSRPLSNVLLDLGHDTIPVNSNTTGIVTKSA